MTLLYFFAMVGLTALVAVPAYIERATFWSILRRVRVSMLLPTLALQIVTVVGAVMLSQVPVLRLGWYLIFSDTPGNVNVAPMSDPWFAWLFIPVFAFAIPGLALFEERKYREGTTDDIDMWKRSIWFGLSHSLWAGVPIAAGLMLTLSGLWYTRQYRRGGVELATAYHAVWNWTLVMIVSILLVVR